jgi:RNA ligase (TIGR02306 family)
MSEWVVRTVTVGPIEKHPNADTLGVTRVDDYPVIVKLGEFSPGDLAVYIPVDTKVNRTDPRWSWMPSSTVKARRLRGVFSMGLLIPTKPPYFTQDCEPTHEALTEHLGLTKYEPEVKVEHGEAESPFLSPPNAPIYTDIPPFRKYSNKLTPGEQIWVTEKLHGANARFTWHEGRLHVGSHRMWKKIGSNSLWEVVANKMGLSPILERYPEYVLYGEAYGKVQDLRYGVNGITAAFFDVFNKTTGKYLNEEDLRAFLPIVGLPVVPTLFLGTYLGPEQIYPLAEGKSTINGANHVREGCVIRPLQERWDDEIGRVILKVHGEGYLLRE